MAAAHSGWSLDSSIARYGVCFYCWLGKTDWFDVDKCKKATWRNLLLETCLAHLNPFDLYKHAPGLPSPSTPPTCPACDVKLTNDFIATERSKMEMMSVQQLAVEQRQHRKTHYGKEKHAELNVLFDHAERVPSFLHHRINTCCAAIVVTFANKATTAVKKKLNQVLLRYGQKWRFAEKKGQRDTRPSGNESRALLTVRGLLRELLCARYGDASGDGGEGANLDDLDAAQ
eukprot:70726-Pleurochrysis_carterae.AAC.1